MTDSERFTQWHIIRAIRLQAAATWILRDVLKQLDALEKDLTAAIFEADLNGKDSARNQRKALREFRDLIDEKISEVYRAIANRVDEDFATIAEKEDEAQRGALFDIFGIKVGAAAIAAKAVSVLGQTMRQWIAKQAGDLQFRTERAIGSGMAAGESPEILRRRVKGWNPPESLPDAVSIPPVRLPSQRALEQILRTGVESVSNDVLLELGDKLPSVVNYGWQQISILDGRTTQICRAYAYKIWNRRFEPIGHNLPFAGGVPRHEYCRSRIVLFMLDDGSNKQLTFGQWMNTLTAEQQKQVFGESRLKMWQQGKLTDGDLLRSQERAIAPEKLND